ncbi:MAG: YqhA family protein, partial [Candidatus Thiodiazotropha sp. (ex Notomyrtea botanica)]|nr:YqhA family protein [Candidatus Thiodiazotropha sp. (ex Notomyrtea botanica)]
RVDLRATTVTHVVEIVDGYLLATVLLIFSLGLYELFISKIDQAEGSESASNVLTITSLDDLKSRLAKVVMMILVVRYFEYALSMHFKTPLDLLQFAGGIALLGLALYLAHLADKSPGH